MKKILSIILTVSLLASTAFGQSGGRNLNQEQIDSIIATSYSNKAEAARVAAIAHTLRQAKEVLSDRRAVTGVGDLTKHPLVDSTFEANFSHFSKHMQPGVNADQVMARIAAEKDQQMSGLVDRDHFYVRTADWAAGIAALHPKYGPGVTIAYAPLKELALRAADRAPHEPPGFDSYVQSGVRYALTEARKDTPEGKALGPYLKQGLNLNPKSNHRDDPVVRDVLAVGSKLKSGKTAQQIVEESGLMSQFGAVSDKIEDLNKHFKEQRLLEMDAARRAAEAAPLRETGAALSVLGQGLAAMGNHEGARVVNGMSDVAMKSANLVESAATMGPAMLAMGWVGVGIAAVSLLQKSKESPSPWPQLFKMLEQISKQIDDLREEVLAELDRIDRKMSNQFDRSIRLSRAIRYDTAQIRKVLGQLEKEMDTLKKSQVQTSSDLAQILFRAEDRDCTLKDGRGRFFPISTERFAKCRATYIDRGVLFSNSSVSSGAERYDLLFPGAGQYESLRQTIDPSGKALANPMAWYSAVQLLTDLVTAHPKHLKEIYVGPRIQNEPTIQDLIDVGTSLQNFSRTAALQEEANGFKLKRERFSEILKKIREARLSVIEKTQEAIDKRSVNANLAQGSLQSPDPNYKFSFIDRVIPFCSGTEPRLTNVRRFIYSKSGCGKGCDQVVDMNTSIHREAYLKQFQTVFQRNLDRNLFKAPANLVRKIGKEILLAEQLGHDHSEVSLCVKDFEVRDFSQSSYSDISYEAFYQIQVMVGRKKYGTAQDGGSARRLVQTLHGAKRVSFSYQAAALNLTTFQIQSLVRVSWPQVLGSLVANMTSFRDENGPEAEANREELRNELSNFLNKIKSEAQVEAIGNIEGDIKRYNALRQQLRALSEIGLNQDLREVREWMGVLRNRKNFPDLRSVVQGMIDGRKVETAKYSVGWYAIRLRLALNKLESSKNLRPGYDLISGKINELERIKFLRSRAP